MYDGARGIQNVKRLFQKDRDAAAKACTKIVLNLLIINHISPIKYKSSVT